MASAIKCDRCWEFEASKEPVMTLRVILGNGGGPAAVPTSPAVSRLTGDHQLCLNCSVMFARWIGRPDPLPGNPQT